MDATTVGGGDLGDGHGQRRAVDRDVEPLLHDLAGGAGRSHLERKPRRFGHVERELTADVAMPHLVTKRRSRPQCRRGNHLEAESKVEELRRRGPLVHPPNASADPQTPTRFFAV